ncbi:unnamed protein product [Ixodes pacificus]
MSFFAESCRKRHVTEFHECATSVTRKIPLSWGKMRVGQTGRCINDWVREHALVIMQSLSGHLAVHTTVTNAGPTLKCAAPSLVRLVSWAISKQKRQGKFTKPS